jgi:hypothetical protein
VLPGLTGRCFFDFTQCTAVSISSSLNSLRNTLSDGLCFFHLHASIARIEAAAALASSTNLSAGGAK